MLWRFWFGGAVVCLPSHHITMTTNTPNWDLPPLPIPRKMLTLHLHSLKKFIKCAPSTSYISALPRHSSTSSTTTRLSSRLPTKAVPPLHPRQSPQSPDVQHSLPAADTHTQFRDVVPSKARDAKNCERFTTISGTSQTAPRSSLEESSSEDKQNTSEVATNWTVPVQVRRKWTAEEDRVLIDEVERASLECRTPRWAKVGRQLGRARGTTQLRWTRVLNPELTTGAWTENEIADLTTMVLESPENPS